MATLAPPGPVPAAKVGELKGAWAGSALSRR